MQFGVETPIRISCDNFYKGPPNYIYDTFVFNRPLDINKIISMIRGATRSASRNNIDTRAKIFIYYENNKPDTICCTTTKSFSYNGVSMVFKNFSLVRYLASLPNINEKRYIASDTIGPDW